MKEFHPGVLLFVCAFNIEIVYKVRRIAGYRPSASKHWRALNQDHGSYLRSEYDCTFRGILFNYMKEFNCNGMVNSLLITSGTLIRKKFSLLSFV